MIHTPSVVTTAHPSHPKHTLNKPDYCLAIIISTHHNNTRCTGNTPCALIASHLLRVKAAVAARCSSSRSPQKRSIGPRSTNDVSGSQVAFDSAYQAHFTRYLDVDVVSRQLSGVCSASARSDAIRLWFILSAAPFDCGWYGLVIMRDTPARLDMVSTISLTNSDPLSLRIACGVPHNAI